MRNILLTIEYDGTNYHGWQRQKNAVSIQQLIEKAIENITGSRANLIGSGRTDSGVHALAQRANFKTEAR
ncbi:MAG TPA: tRNA pseudouridine(38-40) synthase TruA, partial [Clostridia bacterium]|nr:tRNA pseudouridine(38-40) synthase TruA [Clostridia bacterium]